MNRRLRFGKNRIKPSSCGSPTGRTTSLMPRPKISTNLAISADGKISSSSHRPSGWTSAEDHQRLIELRENADALLVGRGTFENDQMTLTGPRNPLRCIVSRSGEIDPEHPIFTRSGGDIHLLITDPGSAPQVNYPGVTRHTGTLLDFVRTLGKTYHVQNLHCEGGGQLIRELAALDLIDEFNLTLAAHTLFGGSRAPTATGVPDDFLSKSRHFSLTRFDPMPGSGECFLTYTRSETQ